MYTFTTYLWRYLKEDPIAEITAIPHHALCKRTLTLTQ